MDDYLISLNNILLKEVLEIDDFFDNLPKITFEMITSVTYANLIIEINHNEKKINVYKKENK